MRLKATLTTLALGFIALTLSGCAFITKGSTQSVVIRSTPEGATVKVNGTEIGHTPLKVKLSLKDLYRVDVVKAGFADQAALVMPTSEEYEKRILRWGIDYDLGAAMDLVPGEFNIELKPALGEYGSDDKYEQMVAQITRADAMLASGELDAATHRYLVNQIISFYQQ
ncbi:MAG: hypothetical protein RIQ79_101 [Verrucomicrobiota bacterium]